MNTNEDMNKQIDGGSRIEGQTLGKEEQFNFKLTSEQTRAETVKTK